MLKILQHLHPLIDGSLYLSDLGRSVRTSLDYLYRRGFPYLKFCPLPFDTSHPMVQGPLLKSRAYKRRRRIRQGLQHGLFRAPLLHDENTFDAAKSYLSPDRYQGYDDRTTRLPPRDEAPEELRKATLLLHHVRARYPPGAVRSRPDMRRRYGKQAMQPLSSYV